MPRITDVQTYSHSIDIQREADSRGIADHIGFELLSEPIAGADQKKDGKPSKPNKQPPKPKKKKPKPDRQGDKEKQEENEPKTQGLVLQGT